MHIFEKAATYVNKALQYVLLIQKSHLKAPENFKAQELRIPSQSFTNLCRG
jgi:hypothetical protein